MIDKVYAVDRGYTKIYTVVNKEMHVILTTNNWEKAVRFRNHCSGSILESQDEYTESTTRTVLRNIRGYASRGTRGRTLEGAS
jgi:hypothetical protein